MYSHSMDHGQLYKQLVEYCCGSLSSSLVNYTTRVLYQIFAFEIYFLVLLLDTSLVVATTFSGMDRVSDDDDVLNIWSVNGLIDLTPDSKQLSFGSGDIDGSMNSLNNGLIV